MRELKSGDKKKISFEVFRKQRVVKLYFGVYVT